MGRFNELVEKRIRSAMQAGEFDDLPGRGKPLALDDDTLVPEALRAAYRALKNAGYLPEELELRREITGIQRLLDEALEPDRRSRASRRLALLRTRLAASRGERPLHLEAEYAERIRRRLAKSL